MSELAGDLVGDAESSDSSSGLEAFALAEAAERGVDLGFALRAMGPGTLSSSLELLTPTNCTISVSFHTGIRA